MIIVSQDKKAIHNFDNILSLQVEGSDVIVYDTINDGSSLGIYSSEERAKEVLQEIVKQKAIFEFFKNVPERTQILLTKDFKEDNEIFDTYEMPEK